MRNELMDGADPHMTKHHQLHSDMIVLKAPKNYIASSGTFTELVNYPFLTLNGLPWNRKWCFSASKGRKFAKFVFIRQTRIKVTSILLTNLIFVAWLIMKNNPRVIGVVLRVERSNPIPGLPETFSRFQTCFSRPSLKPTPLFESFEDPPENEFWPILFLWYLSSFSKKRRRSTRMMFKVARKMQNALFGSICIVLYFHGLFENLGGENNFHKDNNYIPSFDWVIFCHKSKTINSRCQFV